MVLEITNCNNCYKLHGQLTRLSLPLFIKTFQNIFDNQDEVILNIEDITSIDRQGVSALTQLHNQSLNMNKKFTIIGYGNRELMEEFRNESAA